jgi:hypothetical protein
MDVFRNPPGRRRINKKWRGLIGLSDDEVVAVEVGSGRFNANLDV